MPSANGFEIASYETGDLFETGDLARERHVDSIELELLRRIQRDHPTDLWANRDLGEILAASGRPAEAVRYYTAAIALRPDSAAIYVNRGRALAEAGEVDEAIADFSQTVALAPLYSNAHNSLGNALLDKGKVDEAIACYRKAIALDPKHSSPHFGLGQALIHELADAFRFAGRV
jgi:tetratricopeptide (TPR) repeat protein